MKTILSVKEFNRRAVLRHREAINRWDSANGSFPCRSMYVFSREDTGQDRKRGFVVSEYNSHHFYLTRKELPTL